MSPPKPSGVAVPSPWWIPAASDSCGARSPRDVITKAALDQVELAIEAADVIILVVNVREGIVPLDNEAAMRLRRSGKKVVVAVNKVDTERSEGGATEFVRLGFPDVLPVSAIHGEGIEPLMTAALKHLPRSSQPEPAPDAEAVSEAEAGEPDSHPARGFNKDAPLKLVIVGRPNVGKSSLINALTRSERVIVSPIPGTTRDAVDVPFEVENEGIRRKYLLIDTAGMRKTRRVDDSIEFFSVKRAEDSIARCDIAILVLDAENGITEQDKKVADKIVEERRVLHRGGQQVGPHGRAVRKAREDEIDRRSRKDRNAPEIMSTLSDFGSWVQKHLFFLDYAPVIFTSAKSGFHLDRLLETFATSQRSYSRRSPPAS